MHFRLEVLEWSQQRCEDELASKNFPQQYALRHLSVLWQSDTRLPRNILPNLESIYGSILALMVFTEALRPGKIVAFDCRNAYLKMHAPLRAQRSTKALSGIKYLRVQGEHDFQPLLQEGTLPNSIVVIEVSVGAYTVCP